MAGEIGTGTYVDLMAQYHPAGLVGGNQRDGYHEIGRQLARDEYELAAQFLGELGLTRLDRRSRASGLRVPAAPSPVAPDWQPRPPHHDTHPRPAAGWNILHCGRLPVFAGAVGPVRENRGFAISPRG